jgi:hypothetical protein
MKTIVYFILGQKKLAKADSTLFPGPSKFLPEPRRCSKR